MSARPFLAALLLLAGCQKAEAPLRVAAASDLSLVLGELARTYEARTGARAAVTFGSSGLLARQLAEGAPFDVFIAADEGFVDDAVRAGACDAATKQRYARGRLVLWSAGGLTLDTLPASGRVALANPEHAPYGRAAKEALQARGLWAPLQPRLVFAENVRQALQFAQTGNADAAFVARALVPPGEGALVDAALHAPLDQWLVRCHRGGSPRAPGFVAFLRQPDSLEALRRAGFEVE